MIIKQISKQIFNIRSAFNLNFSQQKTSEKKRDETKQLNQEALGSIKSVIYEHQKNRVTGRQQFFRQHSLMTQNKQLNQHLVQITIYMEHNNWKSQFIYSLLNYNKLGFKKVSDYAFLDSSSYMLQLRDVKQQQRWPTVRVIVGLQPRMIINGVDKIQKFFVDNQYFSEYVGKESSEITSLKTHIDLNIIPQLQRIFWHPSLTIQTTFHTDNYYHQAAQKNYMIVGILARNFVKIIKNTTKNLKNIVTHKQEYLQSKDKFIKELQNLSELYLVKKQYFGGDKPNYIDFYLYSHLKTKWGSNQFRRFVVNDICDPFKRWFIRMGWGCEYVSDRITLL